MGPILKQSFWLFLSQLTTRIIGFFYTVFLARSFGVAEFGVFSVALAYFSLVSAIAEFGFNRFLIREIARDKLRTDELLYNISLLRLTLTSILFALFATVLYLFDPDKIRVHLTLLGVAAVIPFSLGQTFDSIFVAKQKLQISAMAFFISSISTIVVGFSLVSAGFGAIGALVALIIGQLVYSLFLIFTLAITKSLALSSIRFSVFKEIFKGSLPYGLLGILGLLYFRIDILMLSYIKGDFETGIYGASFRFLESIMFIPTAISTALFPVLAKLHDADVKEVKSLYLKSIQIMGIMGLLILIGYLFILPLVIEAFLPNYIQSIPVIAILSLSIPFMFIHAPAVQVLLSSDKYLKQVIGISIVTLSFNIIGNLIFIPQFGFMAAAWMTALSEMLSFVLFFFLVKSRILDH